MKKLCAWLSSLSAPRSLLGCVCLPVDITANFALDAQVLTFRTTLIPHFQAWSSRCLWASASSLTFLSSNLTSDGQLGAATLFQHSWSSRRGLLWVPSPLYNFEFPPPDVFLSQIFTSWVKYHLLRKAFPAQRPSLHSLPLYSSPSFIKFSNIFIYLLIVHFYCSTAMI